MTGFFLDRAREQRKRQTDIAKAAELAESEASSNATQAAAIADGSAQAPPPRSFIWRLLNSRVLKFLGFNHLYGLPFIFWCHLASIALYSGSYFTFLGARRGRAATRA